MRQFRGSVAAVVAIVLAVASIAKAQSADSASAPVDPVRLDGLIQQLGSADYAEREAAQKAIEAYGFEAFDALSAAELGDDPEVAARARYLVRRMQVEWASATDNDEVRTILNGYSQGDDRLRRQAIDTLAMLPNAEGLPALARLVRFESAPLRSKQAGLRAVESLMKRKSIDDDVVDAVERTLGPSTRPGAKWLRAAMQRQNDPGAAADTWGALVTEEQSAYHAKPHGSNVELQRAMIRVHVEWLQELDRREDADEAMKHLVLLDPGTGASLRVLVKWFADRGAWSMLDQVEGRFGDRVSRDPVLLYHFAQARERQGDQSKAEELAAKALAISGADPARHAQVGRELNILGMRRYALLEFQKVIDAGPPASPGVLTARIYVAEALYDRGDNQLAADCLRACLEALKAEPQKAGVADNLVRDPPSMEARMLFFEATALKDDPAMAKKKLLQALRADETDLDVLIALHRHEGLTDDERQLVRGRTIAAADMQRMEIRNSSRDAVPYNQLAWLLANTDGDAQEAIECSLKSLEINQEDPGYLDTLAHCYFAAGQYDKAVATEERAVAGDPESGLLARSLERFRAKRDEAAKPAD
jgi:tetratricopeptide (TPR) repeat protein